MAEHTRKCLKGEYLSRIEYDFKKPHVTGPYDHKHSVYAKKSTKKVHDCVCKQMFAFAPCLAR
jgi:hypothetical protein